MNESNNLKLENTGFGTLTGVKEPPIPDRFEVIKLLWLADFLWVYEVRDRQTGERARVWIEQIFDNFAEHNRRSLALLNLTHPNLWPSYDHFESVRARKRFYGIVTRAPDEQFVPLRTLMAGTISTLVAGQIFRQLALVLDYCHSHKIVHCHLQPAFIWISPGGMVRLEMFAALPRLPEPSKPLGNEQRAQRLLGTAYASPEQLIKTNPPGPRLDIYALGVISYEMLAGYNPFLANSELASLIRHTHKIVRPLHEINPDVGRGLEAAIATALVKNPAGRYRTILDFLTQFEIGLDGDLQTGYQPQSFQTIAQLLEQAKSLAETALHFPAFTDNQPQISAPAAISLPAPTPEINKSVEPPVKTAQVARPVQPQTVQYREVRSGGRIVAQVRARPTTPKKTPFYQTPSFIPGLLVLNLFIMGFLIWLVINSPGSTGTPDPSGSFNSPQFTGTGTEFVYPTIDSAELTNIARQQSAAATFQSHFAATPTRSDPAFTLILTAEISLIPDPTGPGLPGENLTPAPTPTPGQTSEISAPTALPATTLSGQDESLLSPTTSGSETPAIGGGTPAKKVTLDFSPPDNFASGETFGENPSAAGLAEADRTFFMDSRFEAALQVYQTAVDQNPGDELAYRRMGRLLYLWAHPTYKFGTVDTLQKAVSLNQNDALAWAYLAFAYFDRYDYVKGADAANQAVALAPDLPEAQGAHALAMLYSGNPSQAVGEITGAAGISSQNANFWVYLAWFKIARTDQDLSGALTLIDDLIQNYPGVASFYAAKGEILWTQGSGNFPQAITLFQKALSLDKNLFSAHSNLGWVYYLQGNYAEAKKEFDLALQNNPEDSSALTGNGYILITGKSYPMALETLTKAVQLNPRNGIAYNGLASASLYLGEDSKALNWANQALQYVPNYADAYFNAGQACYRLNDFQKAITNLQQAARINPSSAAYQEVLAYSYFRLKDFPMARQAAQLSLNLQPDNQELVNLLNQIGNN